MKPFSHRSAHVKQSDIRAVTALVNRHNGINLGQGICDLPTPDAIQNSAIEAIRSNKSIYSPYAGLLEIREKLVRKFQRHNKIPLTTTDEVLVTNGSTGGFVAATFALLNPGDEVLLFEPFYGYHNNLLVLAGAVLKSIPMRGKNWDIPFDELDALISPKSKMIVLNTPNNPCGKVWSRAELEEVVRFAQKHDLWIVTDEVYEYMVFDGLEHISLASISGAFERTITLTSFSKTYNMTGWRMGGACGPAAVMEKMGLVADLIYICPPTPLQYGLGAGLDMAEAYYKALNDDYTARRDYFYETLAKCGFEGEKPQGAYYAFTSFYEISKRKPGFSDGMEAVRTLITGAGVAAVPGHSFFSDPESGRYFLRFCFAKEWPILKKACSNLESFLKI